MVTYTKIMILTLLVLFGLSACSQSESTVGSTPSEVAVSEIATIKPESTELPTDVPTPTSTSTPQPTETPAPTNTPTPEPTATPEPSPTPDLTGGGSGKIIFRSSRDGEETYYIMNYDGSEQTSWAENPLPPQASSRFVPRFSPDGSQIVVSAEIDENRNIFVASADGSNWRQLTTYTGVIVASNPAWSPDGSQIAFDSNEDNGIHVISADGTNHISLIENRTGTKGFPSWSPDGTQIVFNWAFDIASEEYRDMDMEIMVMNADGSAITALTENEFQDIGAVWSPDGTKIAFHSNRDGNFEIYVMNADGSEQTRLTNNDSNDFSPVWSPNGQLIAYTSVIPVGDETFRPEVFVMNADGSNQRSLTNGQQGLNPYWLP